MADYFKHKNILLTGGAGFLGRWVYKELIKKGASKNKITIPRSKADDLLKLSNIKTLVQGKDIVIHLAGLVGGIGFNQANPGRMIYENLEMGIHLMDEASRAGVSKLVVLGTVCCYPKFTPVPFKEKNLWKGYPEETNAPYGLAKKMLLVMSQAYRQQYGFNAIHLMPVNLYGPGDNFNPRFSHVIPALIKKFVDAKKRKDEFVVVWGTGNPTREFLYVEDAAEAIVLATEKYNKTEPVNIGSSSEISIKDLALLIKKMTGFEGSIVWDKTKPDGQPRRKLDVSRAEKEFSFKSRIGFEEGLKKTILWYFQQY